MVYIKVPLASCENWRANSRQGTLSMSSSSTRSDPEELFDAPGGDSKFLSLLPQDKATM